MAAGHSASQAEALAATCPGWEHAPSAAIDVFALASARLYNEIARNDPQPFKQRLAAVAAAVSSSMRVCAPPPVRSVAQSTGQVSWGDAHGEGTVGSERL